MEAEIHPIRMAMWGTDKLSVTPARTPLDCWRIGTYHESNPGEVRGDSDSDLFILQLSLSRG